MRILETLTTFWILLHFSAVYCADSNGSSTSVNEIDPQSEEVLDGWPQLLLTLKQSSKYYDVIWFDPNTGADHEIPNIGGVQSDHYSHPVPTGAAVSDLVCIEVWTFFCKRLHAPNRVEVGPWDKLIGTDDSDQHLRKTLHLEVNPFEGNHIMYLEPIRQAIWLYYPMNNQALLISTFDDQNIINFKVDWINGLLFTTNRSIVSSYSFEQTGLELQYQFDAVTTYLSNDHEARFLYWTDDSGSIFKRHYDGGGVSKVADEACSALPGKELLRIRPLYIENGTVICIQSLGESLKLARFGEEVDVKKTLRRGGFPISSGKLTHYSVFTNTTLDPVRREIMEACDRCSHFCVPINSFQKYHCACPYGFSLVDSWRCENSTALATVAEIAKKPFQDAPEGATHVLQLVDVMNYSKPAWTYAYERSRFHIVPCDDFQRLCLHFPSNNSLKCFSPFEDRKQSLLWTSSPGDAVLKVVNGESPGTFQIFLVSDQLCVQVFQTVNNVTYTLHCDPKIDPKNMFIDSLNWRLFFGTNEGLKIVLLPPSQTESTISIYKSIRTTGTDRGREQENQMVFHSSKEILYFFPNKDDMLFKAGLNNLTTAQKIRIGFRGTQNNAMIYRENLLYLDKQDRILIMSTDHLAGAQYLHDFPDQLKGLQFTMVNYPNSTSKSTSVVLQTKPLCTTPVLESHEAKSCWCPPLMINEASECRPIELLLGVIKRDSSSVFSIHSTEIGSSKGEPVDGLPSTFLFGKIFTHEPQLQRICVLVAPSITCTTYGSNAKVQTIPEILNSLYFAEKVSSTSTNVYWISDEATGSVNRLCLNIGFPQRRKRMRYSCFHEDARLQYPHFIEEIHTLVWTKTTGGICQLRSCDVNSGNVTSLASVPGKCYGLAVASSNTLETKAFVITSEGLYRWNSLNASSEVLLAEFRSDKPESFKLHNDFIFLSIKTQINSRVVIVGPLSRSTSKTKLELRQVNTSSKDEEIVDISFKSQKNVMSSTPCSTSSCPFHCQLQFSKPVCMCQNQEANATVFGLQFEACRSSSSDDFRKAEQLGATSATFLWWPIPVSVFILIIFASCMSVIFWRKLRKQDVMFQRAIDTFMKGNDSQIQQATTDAERALHLPFTAIIPPDQLEISQSIKLGEGNFGVVCQGAYNDQQVAVKTVKNNFDTEVIQDFLKELKIMAYVGIHENIVQFLGAEVSEIETGLVRVVLELCTRGCLLAMLQNYESIGTTEVEGTEKQVEQQLILPAPENNDAHNAYKTWPILTCLSICKPNKKVALNQLCKWAHQIASGMDYLERKNVVHGDLAARNILVCEDYTAKISDFGFSKNMYQSKIYRKKKGCPLPWRWSSPETMSRLEFSFKSDVWSYGVTVWEIFSLGAVPFPDKDWNTAFVTGLKEGMRLLQPDQMPLELYREILLPCWNQAPADRPSFGSLVNLWPLSFNGLGS